MRTALFMVLAVGVVAPGAQNGQNDIAAVANPEVCNQLRTREAKLYSTYRAARTNQTQMAGAGGGGGSPGGRKATAQLRVGITILPSGAASAAQMSSVAAAQPFQQFRREQAGLRRAMRANGCDRPWNGQERRSSARQAASIEYR